MKSELLERPLKGLNLLSLLSTLAPEMAISASDLNLFAYTNAELDAMSGRDGDSLHLNEAPRVVAVFSRRPPLAAFCRRSACCAG